MIKVISKIVTFSLAGIITFSANDLPFAQTENEFIFDGLEPQLQSEETLSGITIILRDGEGQYNIRLPDGSLQSLSLSEKLVSDLSVFDEPEIIPIEYLEQLKLDFPLENVNWFTLIPNSYAQLITNGVVLKGHLNGKFLILDDLHLPQEQALDFAEEIDPFLEDDEFIIDDFADEIDANQSFVFNNYKTINRVFSVEKHELWRLYPQKLIDMLNHYEAQKVIISIPSNLNGSFPLHPIEMARFIELASVKGIDVWARVDEDFVELKDGKSRSEIILKELENYNLMADENAKLKAVQLAFGLKNIESYYFFKNQWVNRKFELYSKITRNFSGLAVDLLLAEETLKLMIEENIFDKFEINADSFSIVLEAEEEDKIKEILASVENLISDNKSFNIALNRDDESKNIEGNLYANPDGSLRSVKIGNWFLLINHEGNISKIGEGYELVPFDINQIIKENLLPSRKQHTTDILKLGEDIESWLIDYKGFEGAIFYNLPEFNEN